MDKEKLNTLMQEWMNEHPMNGEYEYEFELQAAFVTCGLRFNNELLSVYGIETFYMTVKDIVDFLLHETIVFAPHKESNEYD